MTKGILATLVVATAMVSSLTGCAMFNKGTLHYNRTTTIGQELVDLQEAKTKGAISEEEYVKAKKDILEGGPIKVEKPCSENK
jgi:hypothetical protein